MAFLHEDARYADLYMTLANHKYRGVSVGSERTCHQFPGYDVAFDIGGPMLSVTSVPNVFVTHAHNDHIGGMCVHHQRRIGRGLDPARYFVQEDDLARVRAWVEATRLMNRSGSLESLVVKPVVLGERIPVGSGLTVKPFRSVHALPCFGYGLWGKRTRLKAEFVGAGRDAIVAARKRGVDVNEPFEVCEVAFPGDTNLHVLEQEAGEVVRKARVLLLECTFIDDAVSPADTYKGGHVHLDAFIEAARAGAFENEVILLTHFSARYHPDYVRETVERRLQDEEVGSRVRLLLPEPRKR